MSPFSSGVHPGNLSKNVGPPQVEHRKKHRKKHSENSKGTPTPLLLTNELHYGGGPIAELARACRGIKQFMDFKGMPVKLTWTGEGVCHITPDPRLPDQIDDAR